MVAISFVKPDIPEILFSFLFWSYHTNVILREQRVILNKPQRLSVFTFIHS